MVLKSFGCSFIYGNELSDCTTKQFSQSTWPALYAKHYDLNYQCYARAGTGNLVILEQLLSQIANPEPALFVVNWTWIDRFDYTHLTISNDPIASTWNNWHTIMPVDETVLAKTYYQELHTEYRDKLTTLMSIRLVIDTLRQKNIPFIMTYMDDLMFDQRWNTTPAVIDLQEYIKPYMTTFDNHTFVDWSKKNGYPITKIGHPLEEAHAAAGDYMIKVFDKQNTSGLTR